MDKFISVVITAYNETENIEYTLKVFDKMYNPEMPFEVIVAEDGSVTNLEKVCQRKYKFPVTYIWQEDKGFRCALAKNQGIRAAKGSHIFILDGDSFPSVTLIADYWPLIDEVLNTVCLYGWRHIVSKDYTKGKQSIIKKDFRKKLVKIPPNAYDNFSGANVMIPSDLAKKVEWAPDDWVGYGYDDYYFCLNWILNGGTLASVNIDTYHIDEKARRGSRETTKKFIEFKERFTVEYYGKKH